MPKKDKLPTRSPRRPSACNWPRYSGPCAYCASQLLPNSLQPYCVECLGQREMCTFIVAKMDSEEFWRYEKWRQRLQQLMGFAFGQLSNTRKLQLAEHCCELGNRHGYNGNWWTVYATEDLPPLREVCNLKNIPQSVAV